MSYKNWHGGHGAHGRHFGRFRGVRRWHGLFRGGGAMTPDPQVQWAQSCLAQSVDPSVPQDGFLGPQTRQAIKTFQTQQQLPPTGILDPNTVTALQTACSSGQSGAQAPGGQAPPPGGQAPASGAGPQHGHQQHEVSPGYEGEFRPERPFGRREERFREERRWDRDRRPWPFLEAETQPEKPESRTPPEAHEPARAEGPAARTPPEARPQVRVERPVVRTPLPEVHPQVRVEGPGVRAPFEFHPQDKFVRDRERLNWDRGRRGPLQRDRRGWVFRGPDRQRVLWAQACLARLLGPWVVQDGIMGPNTQGAVRKFQEQQQLPVTGFLDETTANALRAACGG